jgi:hypothetical protein
VLKVARYIPIGIFVIEYCKYITNVKSQLVFSFGRKIMQGINKPRIGFHESKVKKRTRDVITSDVLDWLLMLHHIRRIREGNMQAS